MHNQEGDPSADPVHPEHGRRRFLQRAAVAGAATWVAPTILTHQAAAAATCVALTTAWQSLGPPIPSGTTVYTGPPSLTFTYADPTSAVTTSAVDSTFVRGGFNTYHMQLGSVGTGAGPVTITFTFSTPVTDLSFSVLDVDKNTTGNPAYVDAIVVGGFLGGVLGTPQTATTTSNPLYVADTSVGTTYKFNGIANAPNASTLADVGFTFAAPIDTVVIEYRRCTNPNTCSVPTPVTATQGIGISNLGFCA